MSTHLTEEEQIEAFKRWWKEYGTLTVGAVVLASAGYFGFGAYQSMQEKAAQANSAAYDELIKAVASSDDADLNDAQKAAVQKAADDVLAKDGGGLYADLSRLHLAKLAVESGDYPKAQVELEAIVANSKTDSSIDLAKLRLARVKAAQGKNEEALTLLASSPASAFDASYAEARGDILQALGRLDEAYTAYEAASTALNKKESNGGMRANILKFKMDNARVVSVNPLAAPAEAGNPHAVTPSAAKPEAAAEASE